ncbi:FUSC family protein [Spirillospora sp. NPDC048911]|uniref:FUSC family protein n=1 Tax=Spirillospora sp. NPDC048911 TaxID=3364527 RepID=UPI003718F268
MLWGAREAYAKIEGRAAPFYGLASSLALALPLLAGALTGHATEGSMIALGAYLVSLRAPEGPYGARARNLAAATIVVAVGATIGGHLSGHIWLAVAVVPPIVALGSSVGWIGPTAGLAVLLTAVRPRAEDVAFNGFLELLGGVLVSVLLLLPWTALRLRPLRTALSEAAEAVAEALDAVAQDIGAPDASALNAVDLTNPDLAAVVHKPDWEERRRAAARALTAARTTYGLYRAGRGGQDEPTRPERLIEALARILQETVALRALVEAARRRPPDRDWEMEVHVAIAALAARLRLLAGATGTTGQTPLGSVESAAIRRLGRQSEVIRRAGLAGDEDLVAAALIGQIRRSIDRIAGSMESARRIVAGGLRISLGLPRPLDTKGSVWGRAGTAVRTRSPTFRQVTRVSLAVALAMALVAALNLPHGHWLTITVMLCMRGTYGDTIERVVQRVGGTAIGSAIAAVLLALAPGQVTATVVLFVFALAAFALRSVNFTYWALFGTPLAMMLMDFSVPSDWTAAGERIALTIAGGLVTVLATRLLWPAGYAERLPVQLGHLLGVHADLARATAAVVEDEHERLPHDKVMAAEQATEAITEARNRLAKERVPDTERIACLRAAAQTAHRVRDHLIAVARMSREEEIDSGPAPRILDRIADQLEEAAAALEDPPEPTTETAAPAPDASTPSSSVTAPDISPPAPATSALASDASIRVPDTSVPAPDAAGSTPDTSEADRRLDEQFADLDTYLSKIARRRRAEVEAGVETDAFTPLRHTLLQVSGVRYALRSLRGDADDLIESALAASRPGPPVEDKPAR